MSEKATASPIPAGGEEAEKKFQAALVLMSGKSITNHADGLRLMRESAAAGHPGAQHNMGVFLLNGVGVESNRTAAIEWLRKSADQGLAEAQFKLAILVGARDAASAAEASALLTKAAEQGHVEAMYQLAVLKLQGENNTPAPAESAKWFRKAAELGHVRSQVNLGVLLFNGQGTSKNQVEALAWYRKAADSGNAMARFNLGMALANGHGTEPDMVSSYFWLNLAAGQGDLDAAEALKKIRTEMKPDELAQAIRRVTAYESAQTKRAASTVTAPLPLREAGLIGNQR